MISPSPQSAGALYKNSALVTITNHGNNMGCPIGPNPKADFKLPASPSTTYCDETATIVDKLDVPAHYELVSNDAPAQWNMNGPGVLKFNVTIKNVDAVPRLRRLHGQCCQADRGRYQGLP